MFRNVSFNFATAISKYDTFSSYHIVARTRIAKVTNFLSFCTIGISMYQTRILPYFFIPSTFSPQASSPLERYRQTEGRTTFFTPLYLMYFFFFTERAGPYPQSQLYWAGRTMGWMADWTRRTLAKVPRGPIFFFSSQTGAIVQYTIFTIINTHRHTMGVISQGIYRRLWPGDAHSEATHAFPVSWVTTAAFGLL